MLNFCQTQDPDLVRVYFFGLLRKCPFGNNNEVPECPLKEYRKDHNGELRKLRDLFNIAESLEFSLVLEMLAFHKSCYQRRAKEYLGRAPIVWTA